MPRASLRAHYPWAVDGRRSPRGPPSQPLSARNAISAMTIMSNSCLSHKTQLLPKPLSNMKRRFLQRTFPITLSLTLLMSALASAQSVTSTATTESTTTTAGTVSEVSPDHSSSEPRPALRRFDTVLVKTTQYVDDTGAPVSVEVVKSGLPVTVQYVREGDRLIASRVTVADKPPPLRRRRSSKEIRRSRSRPRSWRNQLSWRKKSLWLSTGRSS